MISDKKKELIFFGTLGGIILVLVVMLIIVLVGNSKDKPGESSALTSNNIDSSLLERSELNSESIDDEDGSETASGLSAVDSSSSSLSKNDQESKDNSSSAVPVESGIKESSTLNSSASGGDDMPEIPKVIDMKKYNLYTYSRPFWSGNTVYNESVYPMTTAGEENEIIQLLYDVDKILEVRSSDLKTLYKEGKDYKLQSGKLVIPSGSAISVNKYNEYYLTQPLADHSQIRKGGGYIYFSEGGTFHNRQIAVSYKHKGIWGGKTLSKSGSKLPRLQKFIRDKQAVTIVYYGDSIAAGANASSTFGGLPNTPKWTEMFSEYIQSLGAPVTQYNSSVGGQISTWGADNVAGRVNRYAPDLVVLAFGMNDSNSFNKNTPSVYKANTKRTIEKIRATHPDAEIILVGTMLPNPEAEQFVGEQVAFLSKLYELEGEISGVAVADITSVHEYLMTRKNYRDMTGNNVNHPNDFLSRVYLQVLIETIS